MMDTAAIATVTTAVVVATQIVKQADPNSRYGLPIAAINTLIGLALWQVSQPDLPSRLDIWSIALAFVTILVSASGVYGLATNAQKALLARHAAQAALRRPPHKATEISLTRPHGPTDGRRVRTPPTAPVVAQAVPQVSGR